jgi:hypothetical protein
MLLWNHMKNFHRGRKKALRGKCRKIKTNCRIHKEWRNLTKKYLKVSPRWQEIYTQDRTPTVLNLLLKICRWWRIIKIRRKVNLKWPEVWRNLSPRRQWLFLDVTLQVKCRGRHPMVITTKEHYHLQKEMIVLATSSRNWFMKTSS